MENPNEAAFLDYPHDISDEWAEKRRQWATQRARAADAAFRRFVRGDDHSPARWVALVEEARTKTRPRVEANARAFATRVVLHIESRWRATAGQPVKLPRAFLDDTAQRWADAERQAASEYWRRLARPAQVTTYNALTAARTDADDEHPVAEALAALYLLLQDRQRRARLWAEDVVERVSRKARRVLATSKGRVVNVAQLARRVNVEQAIDRRQATNGAATQVARTYEQANRQLAMQSGSTGYVWLRTMSADPRERHLRRVGQLFHWDAPPQGGHPGSEVNCKCGVRPIWKDTPQTQIRRWQQQAKRLG